MCYQLTGGHHIIALPFKCLIGVFFIVRRDDLVGQTIVFFAGY
ncbi:hypothetical protein B34_01256 [Bacillus licheniformis]|nr:hypothetical protein B34_01256 [Bacillus licheniformis]